MTIGNFVYNVILMIKKGSTTYYLLLALEKTIQANVFLLEFAHDVHLRRWFDPENINYGALYEAVRELREKGFIETRKDGRRILLRLTDKGREEAIVKKLLAEEKWDGKWRIVIFDIPEKHRKLRSTLRSKLREWEFEPWQKSVWAGKKNVTEPLRNFIKEVGLAEWVRVVVGSDVG